MPLRTPMLPRDTVSGRSATAWARESTRRTRWVRQYGVASSWPARCDALELTIWTAPPFGTRLAEVTNGAAGSPSPAPPTSRYRVHPADRIEKPQGTAIAEAMRH